MEEENLAMEMQLTQEEMQRFKKEKKQLMTTGGFIFIISLICSLLPFGKVGEYFLSMPWVYAFRVFSDVEDVQHVFENTEEMLYQRSGKIISILSLVIIGFILIGFFTLGIANARKPEKTKKSEQSYGSPAFYMAFYIAMGIVIVALFILALGMISFYGISLCSYWVWGPLVLIAFFRSLALSVQNVAMVKPDKEKNRQTNSLIVVVIILLVLALAFGGCSFYFGSSYLYFEGFNLGYSKDLCDWDMEWFMESKDDSYSMREISFKETSYTYYTDNYYFLESLKEEIKGKKEELVKEFWYSKSESEAKELTEKYEKLEKQSETIDELQQKTDYRTLKFTYRKYDNGTSYILRSIYYNKDLQSNSKEVKKISLSQTTFSSETSLHFDYLDVIAKVEYEDGSWSRGYIKIDNYAEMNAAEPGAHTIKWHDSWGAYEMNINIT